MSSTALTRLVYARLDELSTAADLDARLEFLCHGLLPNSGNPQAALLWAVLDGIALDGKHILDAGCGRGGALAAIAQRWRPAGLTGLDVSHEQIAACRRRFAAIKARWQVADMCSLPQPPSSQDVLLGVEVLEGLHTPSDFLKGAARVLKPGGLLVMADLMSPATAQLLIQHAADAGFTLQQQVDLSPGVGAAMAERSRPAGEAHFLRAVFRDETQTIERALANGELRYLALHLQRTTAPGQTRAWSVPPLRPAVPRVNHCASIDPPNAVFPYGVPSASGPLPVFAFPFGGGGASVFRGWSQDLATDLQFCPVQLPGREGFRSDSPLRTMDEWVHWGLAQLGPHINGAYALYGHCLGGQLAYELALALTQQGRPPAALWLTATTPPDLPLTARLSHVLRVADLDDADLPAVLALLGGTPGEVMQAEALLHAIKGTLLADFSVATGYQRSTCEPLPCPIHGLAGLRDKLVPAPFMRGWQAYTQHGFELELLDAEHFFLREQRDRVQASLRQQARRLTR